MRVTFLLGPAGSGKTWRCLAEIRDALRASPEGAPLLLLAPKQATFQLERQLLAGPGLAGYTRLQILSFERLAQFVVTEFARPVRLLDEEGRVMVLRALLARFEREKLLRIFHSTARLPGFARQLSLLLRELQRHHAGPERLRELAGRAGLTPALAAKVADLSILLEAYLDWLRQHEIEDGDRLLDLAAELLRTRFPKSQPSRSSAQPEGGGPQPLPRLGGLWLDGFAEMTPQEMDLLAALVPWCERATLAFCLDGEPSETTSWLSTWAVVAQSYRQCRARLQALEGCSCAVEVLKRDRERSRFAASPALAHLEANWTGATESFALRDAPFAASPSPFPVRLAPCANPEAEAVLAAREILRHVRAGGRYRECAVLVRTLDTYHDVLRRVFMRYGIPHFLDRREAVAHHPLAELTRYTLRTLAYGWRQEDWFGVLKSGLLPADEEDLDWLENLALEHGWEGEAWSGAFQWSGEHQPGLKAEKLRVKLTRPFLDFEADLGGAQAQPSGAELAGALRKLWSTLEVEAVLERWGEATTMPPGAAPHQTVWDQMGVWLDNLARAFPREGLSLREWLPIVEAGLSGLTVGVVPPALDQVLVGAVDRSRQPDLRLAVVLGLNEGVFPAPPPPGALLNETDRDELEQHRLFLGPNRKLRLGQERYLGYIACTRARERLVVTWSLADGDGRELKPSLFRAELGRLFPGLKEEPFMPPDLGAPASSPAPWTEIEHAVELAPALLQNKATPEPDRAPWLTDLESLAVFQPLVQRWEALQTGGLAMNAASLESLFGNELKTSVSALEEYAQCPFRFLVARGFRAEERKRFEIDESARGHFQHEVLKLFHQRLQGQGRGWRDVRPEEARALIRQAGEELAPGFRGGVFAGPGGGRFQAEWLIQELEGLVTVLVGWAPQYGLDPHSAELSFGMEGDLPAWRIQLDAGRSLRLRGFIDRVDVHRLPGSNESLVAVIDYKSTVRPLEQLKLHYGLQLQLLSYLGVLRRLERPRDLFGAERLRPAGVFYVGLSGRGRGGRSRAEVLEEPAEALKLAYQHTGRFDAQWLAVFDLRQNVNTGDQFKWKRKKDGKLWKQGNEALPSEEFEMLLDENEARLREIGRRVFAGEFPVEPYRKGSQTACDYCDYRAVCRFDPWLQPYRVLRPPPAPALENPKPSASSE